MDACSRWSPATERARAGVLPTAHGEVETPAFMPVGTKATVKTLHPDEVRGARRADPARQHLPPALPARRRADRRARRPAPLHGLGRADPDRLGRLPGLLAPRHDRRASTTTASRSATSTTAPRPGSRPSSRRAIQREPRQRHRDVPRPGAAARRPSRRSSRTPSAARPSGPRRQRARRRAPTASSASRSSRAAPTASSAAARSRSSSSSTSTATRSAASRSARTASVMFETTDWLAPQLLPPDKPRYFMGIGDPEGILEVIEAGVDMFDCVLPTRTARTGSALTWEGRLNLRNARFARDPAPLDEGCDCPACTTLHAGLHPPPRQPGRAARPTAALAPQSTLRPRADPRRPRGDRARRRSAPTNATRSSGSPVGGFLIVIVILVAVAGSCSSLPARRRQRAHAAMQDAIAVGDEIITAGGMHAIGPGSWARTSCGSRSRPASSSRSTGGRSPPWRARSRSRSNRTARRNGPIGLTRPTRTRANLCRRGVAPLSSDAGRADPRGRSPGVALLGGPGSPVHKPLRKGLDLQGGLEVVLQGAAAEGPAADLVDHGPLGQHHAEPRRQARRLGAASSRSRARTRS